MDILGYSDRLSVQPGQTIRFMVSSQQPSYRAEVVRLIHGDDNPKGPGFKQEIVPTTVSGQYPGRRQAIRTGSYVLVPHDAALDCRDGLTIAAWIYPTTPNQGVQGILTKWSTEGIGYGLFLDENAELALWIGRENGPVEKIHLGAKMRASQWYFVAATFEANTGKMNLYQQPLSSWPADESTVVADRTVPRGKIGAHATPLLLAASWQSTDSGDCVVHLHFNGKIDGPRLYGAALEPIRIDALKDEARLDEDLVAAWDFSLDISTDRVPDTSDNGFHGRAMQMPTRAVTGHNWTGNHVDFNQAPHEYGAIHFHEDDLEDAQWDTDFTFKVPENLKSGAYAAWLTVASSETSGSTAVEAEDHIPFFVRPKRGTSSASIAFLAPTLSYLVYANHRFNNPDRIEMMALGDTANSGRPRDVYMREQKLLSLYDLHTDGTGVCYGSLLRPLVDIRPKHTFPPLSLAAGSPHSLNADLHLIDWLSVKGFEYDVITDEDLHAEGAELLTPYRVVLTGSHPEYWTAQMLEGLDHYLADGGRLMYMGGNGFYWATCIDPNRPHIVEVRRWGGTRSWEAAPGERYHSTTGQIGGIWRYRNRPPQKMLGVGFTSLGSRGGRPYRRNPDSFDSRAAFIFEGVGPDELIGDFDSLVLEHGAAGFEIDRADHSLGTPPHALVLASSFGHSDAYHGAVEDFLSLGGPVSGRENPQIRADMVFFEGPKNGAVFSVGSINWCGCLSFKDYENNVSRITNNVLRHFASDEPLPSQR